MEAIILAGGKGTRLKSVIWDRPKVLSPVEGKPFIFYVLDFLYKNGCTHCVIASCYMAEMIEETIGESYKGIKIDYAKEDSPLGTGGAIKNALKKCNEDNVFILNGDTFFDVDTEKMAIFSKEKGSNLTVALKYTDDCNRYGAVRQENEIIKEFLEKEKAESGFINGGIYLINKNYFDDVPSLKFSFEKDILEKRNDIGAFISDGYFIDIGIPEDYNKANNELKKNMLLKKRKAIFLDRDGTINEELDYVHKKEDFIFIDGTFKALKIFHEKGYLTVVISNQAGIAKGYYTTKDLDILNSYMKKQIEDNGGYLDGIFCCPHHTKGKVEGLNIDCQCRKPKTGLIEQAKEYFLSAGISIDMENSFFVGDTIKDIETGKNANIGKTVIVKSGHSCDYENSNADCICENLYDFAKKYIEN